MDLYGKVRDDGCMDIFLTEGNIFLAFITQASVKSVGDVLISTR